MLLPSEVTFEIKLLQKVKYRVINNANTNTMISKN